MRAGADTGPDTGRCGRTVRNTYPASHDGIHRARSARSEMICRWIRHLRTRWPIALRTSREGAGKNETRMTPCLFQALRALRARNVNPKNVNDSCSAEPRRLLSLQYTILVLTGCNANPTRTILAAIATRSRSAWTGGPHGCL